MQEGWVNRLGHVIADDQIGISGAEVTTVALYTLSKGWIRIIQLPHTREPAARTTVPRSKASSVAILNFSFGVMGL